LHKIYPESNFAMVRLSKGDDLLEGIERTVEELGTDSAAVLFGIGMVEGAEIGYWEEEKREYIQEKLEEPCELVTLSGTLARGGIHLHVALAGRDHRLLGGHLFAAKVAVVAEVGVALLEKGSLSRDYDPEVSLNLLRL